MVGGNAYLLRFTTLSRRVQPDEALHLSDGSAAGYGAVAARPDRSPASAVAKNFELAARVAT